jgi:membrane protease YdiL (CAAX protease family)
VSAELPADSEPLEPKAPPAPPAPRPIGLWDLALVVFTCVAVTVFLGLVWGVAAFVQWTLAHPGVKPDPTAFQVGTVALLVFQIADAGVAAGMIWLLLCVRKKQPFFAGLKLTAPRWPAVLAGAVAGLAAYGLARLLLHFHHGDPPALLTQLVSNPGGFWAFAIFGLLSPIIEETYYRGFVFLTLANRFGERAAAIVVVLWFVALHVPQLLPNAAAITAILILSTVTTALRVKTGSVLPGMLAHGIYNGLLVGGAIVAKLMG